MTRFRLTSLVVFIALIGLNGPRVARAQPVVEDVSIVAGVLDSQWAFLVEVFGSNITTATVAPPFSAAMPLVDDSGTGEQFEFEDSPFATFAALKAAYPSGDYVVTINGDHVVTLGWDPDEILASGGGPPTLTIDAPANGATDVSPMPDVAFSFDCPSCNDLNLEIFDVATGGTAAGLTFGELDVTPPANFTNPILFDDMRSGQAPPNPLPDGLTEIELLLARADFAQVPFDVNPSGHPSFQYIQASAVFTAATVTVPELSAATGGWITLAALAFLARRRAR